MSMHMYENINANMWYELGSIELFREGKAYIKQRIGSETMGILIFSKSTYFQIVCKEHILQ